MKTTRNMVYFILLMFSVGCYSIKSNSSKKISKRIEFYYDIVENESGGIIENLNSKVVYHLDNMENPIFRKEYLNTDTSHVNESILNYKYDSNNNIIEMSISFNSDQKSGVIFYKNKYDSNNNLIEEIETRTEKKHLDSKTITYYKYDSNNNLIKSEIYQDGDLWGISKYKYDSNNNLIESDLYMGEFLLLSTKHKYDSNNNKVELCNNLDEEGICTSKNKYIYNLNGDIIEELGFIGGLLKSKRIIEYIYY